MEISSFFNAKIQDDGTPDRAYTAEIFAKYFASFIGNGVFPNPSTGLEAVSNNDMNVTIRKGKGWINGYFYENTDDLILKIEPADGVLHRIDRIILKLDFLERNITCKVKKGTFASKAVAPTLQRDADAYELCLAEIKVDAGAVSILQSKIIDTRLNTQICGIVTQTIDSVDTTEIYKQLEADIKEKGLEMQDFLDDYKNQLIDFFDDSDNIALNIFNKIFKLQEKIDSSVKISERLDEINGKIESSEKVYEKLTEISNQIENLKKGSVTDKIMGGNATPNQVLKGATFTNDSGKHTGTMENKGTVYLSPHPWNQQQGAGYYEKIVLNGDINLKAENIKKGVSIFNVIGSLNAGFKASGNFKPSGYGYTMSNLSFEPNIVICDGGSMGRNVIAFNLSIGKKILGFRGDFNRIYNAEREFSFFRNGFKWDNANPGERYNWIAIKI